jgi:TPR repeat protein
VGVVARVAFLGACAVAALAACARAPLVTSPAASLPPACPLEGCSHAAWAELEAPESVCPASREGDCAGLTPSACTDEALASWGVLERGRSLGCVAQMLSAACAQGDPRGCGFAGRLWLDGKGLEKDVDRGLRMLTRACDGGVSLACLVGSRYLGDANAEGSGPDRSDVQHRFEMEYSCLSGQGDACMQVGLLFRLGDEGFPRDFAQAVVAYGRGCNLGESRSCNNLGDALAYGEGAARDLDGAVDAFDKSCHLGEALGCANLGFRLERGLGVARDVGRARSLYRDACNVGSAYACLHLELLALEGGRGSRDAAGSLERWTRACDRGKEGRACAFVGLLYDDGPDGLTRDEAKSLAAMARGCDLGEPRACDWVRVHTDD